MAQQPSSQIRAEPADGVGVRDFFDRATLQAVSLSDATKGRKLGAPAAWPFGRPKPVDKGRCPATEAITAPDSMELSLERPWTAPVGKRAGLLPEAVVCSSVTGQPRLPSSLRPLVPPPQQAAAAPAPRDPPPRQRQRPRSTTLLGAERNLACSLPTAAGPQEQVSADALLVRAYSPIRRRRTAKAPAPNDCSAVVGGCPACASAPVEARTNSAPVDCYLQLFDLSRYAAAFAGAGLGCLCAVARLPEAGAVDFVEGLHTFPGHKVKLLHAIGVLRNAGKRDHSGISGSDVTPAGLDGTTRNKENETLKRMCHHNMALWQQQDGADHVSQELERAQKRIAELEHVINVQGLQAKRLIERQLRLSQKLQQDEEQANTRGVVPPPRKAIDNIRLDQKAVSAAAAEAPEDMRARSSGRREREALQQDEKYAREADFLNASISGAGSVSDATGWSEVISADASHNTVATGGAVASDALVQSLAAAIEGMLLVGTSLAAIPPPRGAEVEAVPAAAAAAAGVWAVFASPQEGVGAPPRDKIYELLRHLATACRLEAEVIVFTHVYLSRLAAAVTEDCQPALAPETWWRLTVAASLLAAKVWFGEFAVVDAAFAEAPSSYLASELHSLEAGLAECLGYEVVITGMEYTRALLHLTSLAPEGRALPAEFGLRAQLPAELAACVAEQGEQRRAELLRNRAARNRDQY